MKPFHAVLVICICLSSQAQALEPRTAHTFQLAPGETPPPINLDELHWLTGSWAGNFLGQRFEEVWNPPSAGSMMGMFKLFNDTGVMFYEMQLIDQDAGGLALKVKHFEADFESWEDKADYERFDFIGVSDNAVHFDGISFYQHDEDNLEVWVILSNDGVEREEKLDYQRSP